METIEINQLANTVSHIVEGYAKTVTEGLTANNYTAAKECQKRLKTTSPKRHGAYAKSWVISQREGRPGEPTSYIVHNKKHYRLTHLLEHGHLIKRGNRVIGRVPGQQHIAKAEELAVKGYLERLGGIIGGGQ